MILSPWRNLGCVQSFYPEHLGQMFVVNAPYVFKGIWAVIKPWLEATTQRKIQVWLQDCTNTDWSCLGCGNSCHRILLFTSLSLLQQAVLLMWHQERYDTQFHHVSLSKHVKIRHWLQILSGDQGLEQLKEVIPPVNLISRLGGKSEYDPSVTDLGFPVTNQGRETSKLSTPFSSAQSSFTTASMDIN